LFIFSVQSARERSARMKVALMGAAGLLGFYDFVVGDGAFAQDVGREVATILNAVGDWGRSVWSDMGLPV
jgi:hypothetical protein